MLLDERELVDLFVKYGYFFFLSLWKGVLEVGPVILRQLNDSE